jgi:hypothetical protein
MKAWSEQQGVSGDDSIITMMGDPASEVTQVHGAQYMVHSTSMVPLRY